MVATPSAVKLIGLGKTYRSGNDQQVVLQHVDLDIAVGEFVVVLGRSGSGKSTLLNLLGAMDEASVGRVQVAGQCITRISESARTAFRRKHLGFIFQAYNLLPTLNVIENVCLPLRLNGERDENAAFELLDALEITAKASAYPDTLSGGEQQRVAIARALVHRPSLVLADEPTGNLDIETARQTVALLQHVCRAQARTVVMATHSHEVIGHADRVLKIDAGRLIEST